MTDTSSGSIALAQLSELAVSIGQAADQAHVFSAVADAANRVIGHRLLTVMAFHAESMQVQRLFSSNVSAYPPGSIKNKRDTQWGRLVLDQGRPYIGHNADDIRAHFSDHELINGLGLQSILNVPIRLGGKTLGTMNLLNRADFYDESHLVCGHILAGLLIGPVSLLR